MFADDEGVGFDDCEAVGVSDRGLQVRGPRWPDGEWFPMSQIHDDSEVYELGDTGRLVITEWLAAERGL